VIDIFSVIDYFLMDARKFNPIWITDDYSATLVLWLKFPGSSFKDGFVCHANIIVSGKELVMSESMGTLIKHREEEKKEEILNAAMPYIIGGCTEIANSPHGPWINLMPGEENTDERKTS